MALSTAVKAGNDYNYTLDKLRAMHVMIENFGDEDLRNKYSYIKSLFQESGENLYGQNYSYSYEKFRKLKSELIIMLEKMAQNYLDRTKLILDSTAKNSFDILIEYSRKGGLAAYFTRPFDPMRDVKPYNEKEYHLFTTGIYRKLYERRLQNTIERKTYSTIRKLVTMKEEIFLGEPELFITGIAPL